MSATVRRAKLQDLDRLVPLFDAYRQFYAQPSGRALARRFPDERLSTYESVVLTAESADGETPGFVQLYRSFSSTRAARIFVLNDLFVAAEARRQAIGDIGCLATRRCTPCRN